LVFEYIFAFLGAFAAVPTIPMNRMSLMNSKSPILMYCLGLPM
jgi:hypothetical protein